MIKLLVSTIAVLIGAYILPGVSVDSFWSAFWMAVVLSLLNVTVKPLLILFTIPITLLSLGLFMLVINSLMILMADYFVDGFNVDGFWWAFLFSIVLTLINSMYSEFSSDKK